MQEIVVHACEAVTLMRGSSCPHEHSAAMRVFPCFQSSFHLLQFQSSSVSIETTACHYLIAGGISGRKLPWNRAPHLSATNAVDRGAGDETQQECSFQHVAGSHGAPPGPVASPKASQSTRQYSTVSCIFEAQWSLTSSRPFPRVPRQSQCS